MACTEALIQALVAASRVASAPPAKQGESVHAALVPWSRIHALRAALDDAGIEWEAGT